MGNILAVVIVIAVVVSIVLYTQQGTSSTSATPSSSSTTSKVDCVMNEWSTWGSCDATSKKQKRTRTVKTAASGGGAACPTTLSEEQSCTPTTTEGGGGSGGIAPNGSGGTQGQSLPTYLPKPTVADLGYNDTDKGGLGFKKGWYDIIGQGAKNDYCRYVGDNPIFYACHLSKNSNDNKYAEDYNGKSVMNIVKDQDGRIAANGCLPRLTKVYVGCGKVFGSKASLIASGCTETPTEFKFVNDGITGGDACQQPIGTRFRTCGVDAGMAYVYANPQESIKQCEQWASNRQGDVIWSGL